jgi:ribonucleoside-diphosphate reductase beta chain
MIEKFILHGDATYNLAPFAFPWSFDMAQKSIANHWTPQEIGMGRDRACFEQELTQDERHLFTYVFASLTTADFAAAGNLVEQVFSKLKAAELRMYVGRQIAEETIHSMSYQHILEVLSLDPIDVYTLYRRVPEINDWFEYSAKQNSFQQGDAILPLIYWYGLYEGVFFMCAFAAILSLQRRNLMTGTGQQISYIMRDEALHTAFGMKLVNEIFKETGGRPTPETVHQLFAQAMAKIDAWTDRCIPTVLGYNADLHKQHCRYLADRRLRQLGYEPMYHVAEALPWLDEQVSLKKETNFFEGRVTEYQSGVGLDFSGAGSLNEITNWK